MAASPAELDKMPRGGAAATTPQWYLGVGKPALLKRVQPLVTIGFDVTLEQFYAAENLMEDILKKHCISVTAQKFEVQDDGMLVVSGHESYGEQLREQVYKILREEIAVSGSWASRLVRECEKILMMWRSGSRSILIPSG